MKTRRFENTLREREAEARGAYSRPVGFSSGAFFLCLRAPVPAGSSGERPPPVGPGPPGARDGARGHRPAVRGPGGLGRLWPVCAPGGRLAAPLRSGAWALSGAVRGRGAPRAFEAPQVTGRVRAVSRLRDF